MTVRLNRCPLRFDGSSYVELKDPCPVYDGHRWHLFGTAVTGPHRFELMHATGPDLAGPWTLADPVDVSDVTGTCVAAPGAVLHDGRIHLFVQTDYNHFDGQIEHLVATSTDNSAFERADTALRSIAGSSEAGLYDAHPAAVGSRRYLVYAAFDTIGQPDLHLAECTGDGWDGPWERLGRIVDHEQVACHNQRGCPDYEWGLEGAQLVELPDGRVLLNAVCFTPGGPRGARQRVFFAIANDVRGPYDVLGPVLAPLGGQTSGENGHATAVVVGGHLALFFQERDRRDGLWRYGLATVPIDDLVADTETVRAA